MTETLHDYQEREAEEGRREARCERAERFLDLNAKAAEHTALIKTLKTKLNDRANRQIRIRSSIQKTAEQLSIRKWEVENGKDHD